MEARSEPLAADEHLPAAASEPSRQSGSLVDQIKTELDQNKKKLLSASLSDAARVELEDNELIIEFPAGARDSRDRLARAENARFLREACAAVCGREIGIRFAVRNGETDDTPISPEEDSRRSKQRARQAAAQNPSVQQALRTFGGEIVDVKMG